MFDPRSITLDDTYLKKNLSLIQKEPGLYRGCLEEKMTLEQLTEKVQKASYLETGKADRNVKLYETEDIGRGFVSSFSSSTLKKMTEMKVLSGLLPVHLRYVYGNLFLFLDERDLELKHLLTDIVTVAYNETEKQVYKITIGKHVSPNRLYNLEYYDGVITTLEKALRNDKVNAFHIDNFSSYLTDLPQ